MKFSITADCFSHSLLLKYSSLEILVKTATYEDLLHEDGRCTNGAETLDTVHEHSPETKSNQIIDPLLSSTVSHRSNTPPSQDTTLTLSPPATKSQTTAEDHYNNLESDEEKRSFEKAWSERKHILEQAAEARALVAFNAFQKDNKTLQQVIDSSLKDYVEMYEKAHTVRLQFEAEKSDWTRQVRQSMSDEMDAAAASTRGLRKAVRSEEQDDAISAYRNQMSRANSDSQEFQYFSQPHKVEEEPYTGVAADGQAPMEVEIAVKPSAVASRAAKKFSVPMKTVAIVASTD